MSRRLAMPTTRRAAAALALVLWVTNALLVGQSGGGCSASINVLCGLLLAFPLDRCAGLFRLFIDRRPPPAHFGTACALDPRDGHVESPDLHLIGRVLERRRT